MEETIQKGLKISHVLARTILRPILKPFRWKSNEFMAKIIEQQTWLWIVIPISSILDFSTIKSRMFTADKETAGSS